MQTFGALDIILHPDSVLHNFGRHTYNKRTVRNIRYYYGIGANHYIISNFYGPRILAPAPIYTWLPIIGPQFFRSASNRYILINMAIFTEYSTSMNNYTQTAVAQTVPLPIDAYGVSMREDKSNQIRNKFGSSGILFRYK